MILAKSVKPSSILVKEIAKQLQSYLDEAIFSALFDELGITEIKNNALGDYLSDLRKALYEGEIYYDKGYLRSKKKFGSKISMEIREIGGKWSSKQKAYKVNLESITNKTIVADISIIETKAKQLFDKLMSKLIISSTSLDGLPSLNVDSFIDDISKKISSSLTINKISHPVNATLKSKMSDIYTKNARFYIKKWGKKQIEQMRERMLKDVLEQGYSYKTIADRIEYEHGLSKNKANFIARQEARLVTSRFEQEQASSLGLKHYIWYTSHDERVRPSNIYQKRAGEDHRRLNGKMFSFDDPPIVNLNTGERANPGETFNCRCIARIILKKD